MFTASQIPAKVLAAITAPDTIDIPDLVTKITTDAERFTAEHATGRNLTTNARADVYYGACDAMFNTLLDRVEERYGADRAGQLAADIDARLDTADLNTIPA